MSQRAADYPLRRYVRALGLLGLGIAFTWLVIGTSVVAYLVKADPERAILLFGVSSDAYVEIADGKLAQSKSRPGRDLAELQVIERYGVIALARDPLKARAHRILAEVAGAREDGRGAERHLLAAIRLSKHETPAVALLLQKSWDNQDHVGVLDYADAIMRTQPSLTGSMVPVLASLAETSIGNELVKLRLAQDPPWRDAFLLSMTVGIRNPLTPLDIFRYLKGVGRPVEDRLTYPYLHWLIARKSYQEAYFAWLHLLDNDQLSMAGFVYNGDFHSRPSGSPFDWVLSKGSGVDVQISGPPDEPANAALKVEMGVGRVQFGDVVQRLVLPAGRYTLQGRLKGEFRGRRGLRWRIGCAA